MASRPWLTIKVELVSGRGEPLEQTPGRTMLASPSHTLEQLAEAIDVAFARWDRSHLHEFEIGEVQYQPDGGEPEAGARDSATTALGSLRLEPGSVFEYVFDLGDLWVHRCEVTATDVDPVAEYGGRPRRPEPVWGWGWIPDQYGRTSDEEED
jgi:hypothetical protein